jgi:hypothetical protein
MNVPVLRGGHRAPPWSALQAIAGVLAGVVLGAILATVHSRKLASGSAPVPTLNWKPGSGPSSPPRQNSLPDIQELRARDVRAHRAAIERHQQEPVDQLWSQPSARRLREFLSALPTHSNFAVRSVDCRTSTCVAELRFPTYAVAQSTWRSILNIPNPLGCGTEITLEDPQPAAPSYDLSVVYDCGEVRAPAPSGP